MGSPPPTDSIGPLLVSSTTSIRSPFFKLPTVLHPRHRRCRMYRHSPPEVRSCRLKPGFRAGSPRPPTVQLQSLPLWAFPHVKNRRHDLALNTCPSDRSFSPYSETGGSTYSKLQQEESAPRSSPCRVTDCIRLDLLVQPPCVDCFAIVCRFGLLF